MSQPKLAAFLIKLDKELSNFSEYRKELNRQPHTFVFHKTTLLNETLKQLRKGNKMELDSKDEQAIKAIIDKTAKNLIKELNTINGAPIKPRGGRYTLVFDKDTNVTIPHYRDQTLPYKAFTRVKFAYRTTMNAMFTDLQDYLRNHKTLDTIKTKKGAEKASIMHFFDAGHDKNAGVFERFLDTKTAQIMHSINSSIDKDSNMTREQVLADLKKHTGIDLKVKKVDDLSTIIVSIESASVNRSRGSKTGLRSKKMRGQITKILEKANLADLEGSDSLKQQKIKKTKNAILEPFRDLKSVKVSKKDKIKKSSKRPAVKRIKTKASAKVVSVAVAAKARKTKARKKAQESPASSMLQMVALMNKELPEVVKKNMNSPALVNRTGRFAESVRVTDVLKTPQGFSSIGYTYQRDPYQVFEEGSGSAPWANGFRDPRALIDKSIREIALQFALGRLYTRRL